MQPARAFAPNATTFLTHLVGGGLADTRYVVERFKSMLDGDIRPVDAEAPKGSRRRKAKRVLATLKEVKEMRPGRVRGTRLRTLNASWQVLRKKAGHEDVRLHDLRHSFASRTLALRESLPTIGKLLGHKQVQTTAPRTPWTALCEGRCRSDIR